uniref:GATA-type domain-containing protein n=1 Tax=Caenorhabditis tropicalis TaxID=1561998 RepID=A0A1I7U0X9_9PELO
MIRCELCKTLRSNAWYKNEKTTDTVVCNNCCDSSVDTDPKNWTALCVKCLMSEAAYPIYTAGFKQYACW